MEDRGIEVVGEKSDKKENEVKPKPKYFLCDECGASFTSKRGLNRHIAIKHLITDAYANKPKSNVMIGRKDHFWPLAYSR